MPSTTATKIADAQVLLDLVADHWQTISGHHVSTYYQFPNTSGTAKSVGHVRLRIVGTDPTTLNAVWLEYSFGWKYSSGTGSVQIGSSSALTTPIASDTTEIAGVVVSVVASGPGFYVDLVCPTPLDWMVVVEPFVMQVAN